MGIYLKRLNYLIIALCEAQFKGYSPAMLRKLYNWTMSLAAHKHASPALAAVSFSESSFFPIPPDILLLPMVINQRQKAWFLASLCTISSVLGGLMGYAIGYYFFALIGEPVLAFYNGQAAFEKFTAIYGTWGAWVVLAAAISFIPFKIATIASGVAGLPLLPFLIASTVGRATRFFAVAALAYFFGPTVRHFVERHFTWVSLVLLGLLIGGFLLIGKLS